VKIHLTLSRFTLLGL